MNRCFTPAGACGAVPATAPHSSLGNHSSPDAARYRFRYVDQHGAIQTGTGCGTPAALAEAAYAAGAWGVSIIEAE